MTALRTRSPQTGPGRRPGWSPARIVSAVIGALLALCSLGLLGAGGAALWASTTQRHGGDIDLGTWSYRSTGYAVVSSTADLYGATGGLPVPRSLLGTVRIHVTSERGAGPVFAGIAPAAAAGRYLAEQGTRIADAAGGVTDEAWANAAKHYHEDQLAALVCAIAFINAFNRGFVMVQQPAGDCQPGPFG